tara:strand:+ start:384 stop:1286 length:903 start_codon:yes stop_codon:yes gene_type:complete
MQNNNNMLSLYIPRIFANISKERVAHIFKSLFIGEVSVIDFVPREDSNTGEPYNMAFVHFGELYDNTASKNFQAKVNDPDTDAKIVYDDPWYWICLPNLNPKPDAQRLMENDIQCLHEYIERLHSVQMMQHQTINWLTNRISILEANPRNNLITPVSMEEKTPETVVNEDCNCCSPMEHDEYSNVFEATMEEGEIPEWYNESDNELNTINLQDLAERTAEFALEQFTPEEIEKLDYEMWKENNQPLDLPLYEGQVESDKKGCLWVFTDCNDEPVWRRIPEDDARYEQFSNMEKIQRATTV